MELTFAHQRIRFCMFRTYYPPVDGPIKLFRSQNERPFAEAETKLFFEVDPTAHKAVLATLFSK
jgi:hypothetical protein